MAPTGAGRTLPTQWLAQLLLYTRIFMALDADKAGTLNATRLAAASGRVTPVRVPEGNDVTEYYQAGGGVRAWVMAVIGDDARFPLRVVIPPDEARLPGLAVPAGRWQQPLTLPSLRLPRRQTSYSVPSGDNHYLLTSSPVSSIITIQLVIVLDPERCFHVPQTECHRNAHRANH